jgi:hypothetical protein
MPQPSSNAAPAVDVARYGLAIPEVSNAMLEAYQDAPNIIAQGTQLFIDGEPAGDAREVLETGKLQRQDQLFELLKARRTRWRAQHPGAPLPGQAVLWFDETTPLLVFKSAFQTAAFAGYPSFQLAVRGHVNGQILYLPFEARVPGPAQAHAQVSASFALHVDCLADGRVQLAWKALDRVERVTSLLGQSREERLAQLPRGIEEEWNSYGGHRSKDDRSLDQATVHLPNSETLAFAARVLDAIYTPRRDYSLNGQVTRVPAFDVTFSVN